MSLKKAAFYIEDKNLAEQDTLNKIGPNYLEAQYNPENLSFNQGASWKRREATLAKTVSPIQFQNTQPKTLSMDLIWDTSHSGDANAHTTTARALL